MVSHVIIIHRDRKFWYVAATLPLPPIPPPPMEDVPGPAVPPRRNIKRYGTRQAPDGHHRGTYTEVESDFEPHYLVTTASGTVFIPPGQSKYTHTPPPFLSKTNLLFKETLWYRLASVGLRPVVLDQFALDHGLRF